MADNLTTLPAFSDTVEQRYLIEPLAGSKAPASYLDRFPDELYNKAPESHLVRFMYALLGPAGLGQLHDDYLQARLILEDHGLELVDLEDFYGSPFKFGRILAETYTSDPTGLLSQDQWDEIRAKDARYRSRAIDFFNGVRAGNTPEGMRLVARSGLGHDVTIVENYRALFDAISDDPLGIPFIGQTDSLAEMIVVPQHETSTSAVQDITVAGAAGGNFQVGYAGAFTAGIPWPSTATSLTATPVVGGGSFTAGTYFWLVNAVDINGAEFSADEATAAIAASGRASLSWTAVPGAVSYRVYRGTTSGGENALIATVSAPTVIYLDTGTAGTAATPTGDLPPSASLQGSAAAVQAALEALGTIGPGNVRVTGGPAITTIGVTSTMSVFPYQVLFTGKLASMPVSDLQVIDNLTPSSATIVAETTTNGVDAADELAGIPAADRHSLQVALDRLKPVGVLPTVYQGRGARQRQPWQQITASNEAIEVLRYVTGQSGVAWPHDRDYQWITKNVEKQGPRGSRDVDRHYQGFHNVTAVSASSLHVGRFNAAQSLAFPFLAAEQDDTLIYTADRALADYAEPLTLTSSIQDGTTNVGLLAGIYPAEYFGLAGVPDVLYRDEQFWSSAEATSGSETLILDLGNAQAVNFLAFEVSRKPLDILVEYDTLDYDDGTYGWTAVTPEAFQPYPSSIGGAPSDQSPWQYTTLGFTDALGQQIFTRYIRITFSRRTSDGTTVFLDGAAYSVETRNLRIGRNVT